MFGLSKRKDPICGMKEEKNTGMTAHGKWFCAAGCLQEYEKRLKGGVKKDKDKTCCH